MNDIEEEKLDGKSEDGECSTSSNESDHHGVKDKKHRSEKSKKTKKEKKDRKHKKDKKKEHKKKKSKKHSRDDSDNDSSSDDSTTIRSSITGKKIKRHIDHTYSDRVDALERAAKRQFMNSQF